jgi:hypothetical protein
MWRERCSPASPEGEPSTRTTRFVKSFTHSSVLVAPAAVTAATPAAAAASRDGALAAADAIAGQQHRAARPAALCRRGLDALGVLVLRK